MINSTRLAFLLSLGLALFGCADDKTNGTDSGGAGGAGGTGGAGADRGAGGAGGAGAEGGAGGNTGWGDLCEFESCGGDPMGVWSFDGSCLQPETIENPFDDFCQTATLIVEASLSGTVTFLEDGRYETETVTNSRSIVTVPAECLQGEITCETLQTTLAMGDPDDPDAEPVDVSCAQETPDALCICTVDLDGSTDTEIGAYAVNDTQLVLTPDAGQPDAEQATVDFCVNGDNLTVRLPASEDSPENVFVLSR